jgi:hypothetical protein
MAVCLGEFVITLKHLFWTTCKTVSTTTVGGTVSDNYRLSLLTATPRRLWAVGLQEVATGSCQIK